MFMQMPLRIILDVSLYEQLNIHCIPMNNLNIQSLLHIIYIPTRLTVRRVLYNYSIYFVHVVKMNFYYYEKHALKWEPHDRQLHTNVVHAS